MNREDNKGKWNLNSTMLACLICIMGFCGEQLWQMNSRVSSIEAKLDNLNGLRDRVEALEISQARHWIIGDGK